MVMVLVQLGEMGGVAYIIFGEKLYTWKVYVLSILKLLWGKNSFINLQFIAYCRPPINFQCH